MLSAVAWECSEKDRYVVSRLDTRHNYFVTQSRDNLNSFDKSTMALLEGPRVFGWFPTIAVWQKLGPKRLSALAQEQAEFSSL